MGGLHRVGQAGADAHRLLDLARGVVVDPVAGRAGHGLHRLHQRRAGGEHGGQRAGPARDHGLAEQAAEDRQLQQRAVGEALHLLRFLQRAQVEGDAGHRHPDHQVPVLDKEVGDGDHQQRRRRQVGAEAGEHALERRDHEQHQDHGHGKGHRQHRDRVDHRRLDLAFQRDGLFHVERQALQQRIQDTALFAGIDQVAVQRIEVLRMAPECRGHAAAGLDVEADVGQQLGEVGVHVATRDDVDRLQQRDAGLEHGRQLPGEVGNVLLGDLAPARGLALLQLDDGQALLAQRGGDLRLVLGAQLAGEGLALAVLAFPLKDVLGGCLAPLP
ncbi:hypothetical protein D9M72_430180 [compost metagenome]